MKGHYSNSIYSTALSFENIENNQQASFYDAPGICCWICIVSFQ